MRVRINCENELMTRPRFFVPEVVQTSEMDCGPASLKALLEGFGIHVSYGRLREACQTQVDGTSIDTIEDVAVQLGLDAAQTMLPADHLCLREANALPALVVVVLPNGLTHFVVVWNVYGAFVQVMDPGKGRRWTTWGIFARELFIHTFAVPAQAWREWAGGEGFLAPLRRRMSDLDIAEPDVTTLIEIACQDESWQRLAVLDATVRMVAAIVKADGIERGKQAADVITRFLERGGVDVPQNFWFGLPAPEQDGVEMLALRGAVLVPVTGVRETLRVAAPKEETPKPLPPELAAALAEPPLRPELEIWRALKPDGWLVPSVVVLALFLSTLGVTVEALLLQAFMRVGQSVLQFDQRVFAAIALFVFLGAMFALEAPLSSLIQRLGRRVEMRLRIAFLEKIPRLGDRYFHSRLTSDMANRAQSLASLRGLPNLAVSFLRLAFQLILTSIGVLYLDPVNAPLAILFSGLFIVIAAATNPILQESSLRVSVLGGALARFYLDAMLGLIPLKTHGAERALRREHEGILTDWIRANLSAAKVGMIAQSIGALVYSAFAITMVFNVVARGGSTDNLLLLFYWTLNLPALAQGMYQTIQRYPTIRNDLLRVLEPLGAPEESQIVETSDSLVVTSSASHAPRVEPVTEPTIRLPDYPTTGLAIEFQNVIVQAGGHTILSDINLKIGAGEHIALVGASGAGKSSLVGVLLGWHKPMAGRCLIDTAPLDGNRLQTLRRETAWVDPAVQLWNRSLFENLAYGADGSGESLTPLIEQADLYDVMARLPNGLQTELGESGGLVSGGEGQRVRLGRAMNRRDARLVILDEPFRGLDRDKRRTLLTRAREYWKDATLICITHDVGETRAFDRVVVIANGRIVEDAKPMTLARRKESRYRALLDGEKQVRRSLWESAHWRRWWVEEGVVKETSRQVDK